MDETAIPKIPAKLITRSKAKSSTGYRQIVNFLDNLSRDETGAPVKWKFNQTGVKLARGIGKKIADAGKQGTALKYDARTSLVKAVLRKKYSSSKTSTSCTSTKGKNAGDSDDSSNMVSNGDIASVTDEERLINENKSIAKKTVKRKNETSVNLGDSETASIPVQRKRGRPPKKKAEKESDSVASDSVQHQKSTDSMNKVQSWTNLNQKVFKKSLIGKLMKKNAENISCEDSADSDSRVDSEVETESVASSVSSVSVKKKMKHLNRTGIVLGPAKLLRSQDSLMTRKSKGMKASLVQANRKPRKRTLSGEFELLDESLLRKKLRQDEDHQSDIDSDFSESIQKSSTKLDDSDEECNSVTSGAKVTSDVSKKQVGKKTVPSDDKDTLNNLKKNVCGAPTEDPSTTMPIDDISLEQPKKRGRPPRSKPLHSSPEQIKKRAKPKLLGPKCAQERARNMLLKKNNVAVPRTELQIIGPGGLVFMRKSAEQPKQKLCDTDSLHESDLKSDIPLKEEVSSTTEKYTCDKDSQSVMKPDISFSLENKNNAESIVKSTQMSIDTKENVVPPKAEGFENEAKFDISKTEESLNPLDIPISVKLIDTQSDSNSVIKDDVSDKDHKLCKENIVNDVSLAESSVSDCELKKPTLESEIRGVRMEGILPEPDDPTSGSLTVIHSQKCGSAVSERIEQEQQITSSNALDNTDNTCIESNIEKHEESLCAKDQEINKADISSGMHDSSNLTPLPNNLKETDNESHSKTVEKESSDSLKDSNQTQDMIDDKTTDLDVNHMQTAAIENQETSCNEADRNTTLDVSLESNEVDMYNSAPQCTEDTCKRKEDTDGKIGKLSPLSDDDRSDNKVEGEKKLNVKREFQLRQKASRSPLEIIAMRQSQEERQYILEQTQKAMRREEKQKKMREKIKKIESENMEKKEERKKDEKTKVAELNPDEKQDKEDDIDEMKVPKEKSENNFVEEQIDTENEQKKMTLEHPDCKACSVVLIDFVKYLKMTNSSYSVESGSVMEEWETIEDTETTLSEGSAESSVQEETQETELLPKMPEEEPNELADVPLKSDDDDKSSNKVDENKPVKKKRKPSARKQARPVTYSAQLTAEIVSNPFFTGDETQTVPPLRLKIKQNIIAKPKPRSKKGMKFTVKKRRTARKGMRPEKGLPKMGLFLDGTDATAESSSGKKTDIGKNSFEKNLVEFYQNNGNEQKMKAHRKQRHAKTTNQFSFETINDEETALSKQPHSVNSDGGNTTAFQCTHDSCGFVSETKRVMESHVYVHLKNIPFRCVHCNQVFQSRGLTFLHMRSTHPDLDARMEAAEKVEESLYYKEIKNTSLSSMQSPSRETTVIDSSLNAVAPLSTTSATTTGCYCCSHCDFSAPTQQDILTHIHAFHSNDIEYTCTLCNMTIPGSKEGIPNHFAKAHPNQPVTYKCLPEFYDVTKTQHNAGNGDKGNIFDRMNDLFTTDQQGSHDGRSHVQKTSAEADSTTAEMEDSSRKEEIVDGIEELGKTYQSNLGQTPNQNSNIQGIPIVYAAMQTIAGPTSVPLVATGMGIQQPLIFQQDPSPENNDMGLKIVDVVSLANTWNQQSEQRQEKSNNVPPVEHAVSNIIPPREGEQPNLPNNQSHADPQHALLQMQYEQRQKQHRLHQKQQQQQGVKGSEKHDSFGTTYKCEKCNVHAPILSAMVEHLRVTHKDIQRLFLCPYCRQYEGSNEPEIHRHIKQFHQTPDQKSPPVALSSAAKKHLRTIQVPVDADAKKVGDKYVVEKDIYKCLKCQKHMPSLNFIYDHLEKTHHEVFVYVCPYCKIFKAKTEAQVFHHIKNEHKKCTEDIMLSLAIEENLFTRVQSLVKEKPNRPTHAQKSQQAAKLSVKGVNDAEDEVIVVGESHKHGGFNMTSQPKPMQPNIPTAQQSRMRMPKQNSPMQNAHPPPAHFQSKSSLRKSTPHHIPPQSQNSEKEAFDHQNYQQFNIPRNRHGSAPLRMTQSSTVPPPLMRAPPPLLRFTSDGNVGHVQNPRTVMNAYASQSSGNVPGNPPFSLPSQRVVSQQHGQHLSTTNAVASQDRHVVSAASQLSTARPVLRVPSVATHLQQQRPDSNMRMSPYQDFNRSPGPITTVNRKGDGYAPLDLSKSPAPPSQTKDCNDEGDDLPPDAFQIFNLRPASQQVRPPIVQQQMPRMPVRNMAPAAFQARFRQQMQMQQQMNRMSPHMVRSARQRQPMMNRPPPYTRTPRHSRSVPRHYTPRTAINQAMPNVLPRKEVPAPIQSDLLIKDGRDMGGLGQLRVFKCPYCPDVVPLGMGEVAPHIEKVHPGHSIVFMKIDK
ncbi:uncharacterized protein LOC117333183 [Pecten maximus]|uniref:uncharacterized protein LOC117333183 n=1 Tax=Pecten maximus TaxID=6579 RepID=UPI0014588D3F|nr:uncharacterized protein LOC117333183 [Pecten maximus]